jgi:hypothetical protein
MLRQPPANTSYFKEVGECLWIAYDSDNNKTDSISCPYRIGNRISETEKAISIKAAKINNKWFWQVGLTTID